MDREQIDREMLIHAAKMEGKKLAAQGVQHAPESLTAALTGVVKDAISDIRRQLLEEPRSGATVEGPGSSTSAWDWKPDPRATDELQKPTHEFGGVQTEEPAPDGHQPSIER